MKKLIFLILPLALLLGCAPRQTPTEPAEETTRVTTQAPTEETIPAFDPTILLGLMSVEEKVGQMILTRCPKENALEEVSNYHLGGYVLFGRDFENDTPDSVREKIAAYQSRSRIPMVIAVDEEGGTVTRVSCYEQYGYAKFPAPRELYAQGGAEAVLAAEKEKSRMLADLGINVNLAPVCDITTDEASFMYKRSLGLTPELTAQVVSGMVQTMAQEGVGAVLKHFPGYGNNLDTHVGIAVDSRPLEELEAEDLLPFARAMTDGCGAVMVNHIYVECLDKENPATLSPIVHDYIRNTMNFEGVILTDDLAMDAIAALYGPEEAAILAVLAGNDVLCCSDYAFHYEAVLEAVQTGRIPMQTIDEAVCRILIWKNQLGLIV